MLIHLSREWLELRLVEKGLFEIFNKDDIRLDYNGRGRNTLRNGLCRNECDKVSSCVTVKEICDTLQFYYECFKSLKKDKLSKLMKELDNFKLKKMNYLGNASPFTLPFQDAPNMEFLELNNQCLDISQIFLHYFFLEFVFVIYLWDY